MYFPVPQGLRQEGDRDCSVPVFAQLAGISREDLLTEMPLAGEGEVAVHEWEEWLGRRGLLVTRYKPSEEYTLPCAHLVFVGGMPNWIYQDKTGVHDPDPNRQYFAANDPRMLALSFYDERRLTISVLRPA